MGKKSIEGNVERYAEFSKTYKKYCLRFILSMSSRIASSESKAEYNSFAERFVVKADNLISPMFLRSGQTEIPFYFALFKNAEDLLEFTEKEIALPFYQSSCIDAYMTKKQRKVLQQGYNSYHRMTEEEKYMFFRLFKMKKS